MRWPPMPASGITPETASRLHFDGVLLRRVEMKPLRPVEMVFSYRKDNDNPVLKIFRRAVLERAKRE